MDTIYSRSGQFDSAPGGIDQAIRAATHTEQLNDHIQINTLKMELIENQVIDAKGPPTFCIAVFMDGYGQLTIENGPALQIEPGMAVVFHAPQSVHGRTIFYGDNQLYCLDLRFSPAWLCSFGVSSLSRMIPLFQHNCSVEDIMMLARPASARLMAIAREILDCPMTGLARTIFLQAKALEALAQVLATLEPPAEHHPQLNRPDHQKIRQAIQLLDQHYAVPWTIARLAREVGINERKLKSGFHQLAQSTVHNYLEEVRLNAAKEMLEQGDKVIDVALAVGYATSSHFTKRFRQRFDMVPSQWRKAALSSR